MFLLIMHQETKDLFGLQETQIPYAKQPQSGAVVIQSESPN